MASEFERLRHHDLEQLRQHDEIVAAILTAGWAAARTPSKEVGPQEIVEKWSEIRRNIREGR